MFKVTHGDVAPVGVQADCGDGGLTSVSLSLYTGETGAAGAFHSVLRAVVLGIVARLCVAGLILIRIPEMS